MSSNSGRMFQKYVEEKDCVSLLTSKDHKLRGTFFMTPCTTTIANTLRRQILVATPSIGFKTEPVLESNIKITKNTTPVANEMIAHRIGMIPIAGDPATFDSEQYIFQLNVTNDTDSTIDITASDFKIIHSTDGTLLPTEQFFPRDPITGKTCLITRLRAQWNPTNPPESLILTAKATVEMGSTNIRWSPVSQCSYENTLDTDEARQKDMFEQWVKESKKIEEGAEAGLMAQLRREFDTMEVKRCFKVNELGEPNHFTFHLESVGMRSIPLIVMDGILACRILVGKYKDIDTMIQSNVTFQKSNARYSAIDCIFQNEGHTLGNLLQTYLVYNHMEGSKEPRLAYAGYKIPHPLKAELVITIAVPPAEGEARTLENEKGIVRYAIAQVCRSLSDYFEEMANDWSHTTGAPLPSIINAAPAGAGGAGAAAPAAQAPASANAAPKKAAPTPTNVAPAPAAPTPAAPTPAAPAPAAPAPAAPAPTAPAPTNAAPTPAAPTPAAPAPAAPAPAAPTSANAAPKEAAPASTMPTLTITPVKKAIRTKKQTSVAE